LLLDLNSELNDRRCLARELKVNVSEPGRADHNEALRKTMMEVLKGNGGQVPERIRSLLGK